LKLDFYVVSLDIFKRLHMLLQEAQMKIVLMEELVIKKFGYSMK
jgi:hypothetical protein